ncbi:MAG TPA: phenylalanine--tRNA ligase subunit beta [Steroidobacteraceae bacterium]|nr:phenylalanine--tRNA ligase subunit beta [Steroidobacteraceae bacterium]
MKITHHWMREFTPLTVTAAELAKRLTLAGLEVEAVTPVAPPFSGVVVGKVLECGRHPNAEKLSVCEVTTDGSNRLQIICGAPNVRGGLTVAVATVGAELPGGVVIKRAKLRGLESNGMLCSARELGLGDEHDGILELEAGLALGADVREALDLDDTSLEVNATPNRGDCMSVFGIARDYAAAHEGRYLTYGAAPVAALDPSVFPASIEAPAACPLFASRIIRGVRPKGPSPAWLRERLRRVGINSISPIVDVTNYVMLESGQPMHAYDLERLSGGITVRMAQAGERLTLLDDKEYVLDPEFLVIADGSGAIGLAGIMGGRGTAISDSTTDVLLEAAHFAPDAIAGRARRLGLFTDAAQRFERGVDPTLPLLALERATALLLQIAGGEAGPAYAIHGKDDTARREAAQGEAAHGEAASWVTLRRSRLTGLLGVAVPDTEVQALLAAVTGGAEPTAGGWRVRSPAHRFDLRIEADLIEEVARLRGFDRIVESHAVAPQIVGHATESRISNDRLLNAMADMGYREAITYSFVDPALQRLMFPDAKVLALANPISADLSEMRVSLWTGLIQAARDNLRRQQPRVRLFEIGNKFEVQGTALREIETLAGIATGTRWPEQWGSAREPVDFFDVKADLVELAGLTGSADAFRFEAASLSCLRPGRAARIFRDATPIGWLGEVHPQLVKALGLSAAALIFELEIESAFNAKPSKFIKISKFPSVRRDLAVVIDESVPLAVLQENVTVSASGLLSELRVFDVYRGPSVDSGRKSIALGLILQDSSRTLTDVDADAVVTKVVARLRDELSASIRDQ